MISVIFTANAATVYNRSRCYVATWPHEKRIRLWNIFSIKLASFREVMLFRRLPKICFVIGSLAEFEEECSFDFRNYTRLRAHADDVNLLGGNIDNLNKNTETLIDTSKEVGLEVNVEKIKYMLVSRNQNAGQNLEIKIRNISFENMSQIESFRTTVTNQNLIE
jgi:hypothetical protein